MSPAFDWAQGNSRFPDVMFKRAFVQVSRPVLPGAGIVTAYTDGQVTLRSNRTKVGYHEAADISSYKGVRSGDFVVHGLDILRGSVGVSDSDGAISPVCTVCRPVAGVQPQFVAYAMRAQAMAGVPRALARGVREGGADFRRWDTLGELPIPLPSLDEQRRIANFLDSQVAVLDRAIELRQQQLALASERLKAQRDYLFNALDAPRIAIRYLADFFSDGDWIESPYIVDAGIRLIQTGNVGVGRYKDQGFRYVTDETFAALGCTEVQPGDVLISRLSPPVGRAALAPDLGERMIASVDVAILRSAAVSHSYLVQALSTQRHLADVDIASRGATMARVSRNQLGSFRVPVTDQRQQRSIAAALEARQAAHDVADGLFARSLELLRERKQALITGAVSGQFDVTSARSVVR